ncbi:hypothetical protein [Streptomyces sp. NPDC001307]|uniref:hypothetical protein n=1 Tax=Streptomyces sp. NPDC001307 TaxID=3364560 RepID=UPI0036AE7608
MAYVRGHRRSDGTYVRPHYRRTRPAAARPARPAPTPRRVNTAATRPSADLFNDTQDAYVGGELRACCAPTDLSLQALVAAFATGKHLVDEAAARASVSEVVGDRGNVLDPLTAPTL